MKKLNRRQWVLYEYLKLRENKEWKTREQILNDLSEYYDYRPKTNNNLYYNKSAVLLTKDILKINNNQTIQKIVISQKCLKMNSLCIQYNYLFLLTILL